MVLMEINYEENIQSENILICPQLGQVRIGRVTKNISPVNMNVMMLLIKNQGQVVSRNQLFEQVWTNQVVSDDTLTKCISDLRAQIGKGFIKTLPKRGYQWVKEVKQSTGNISHIKSRILQWIVFGLLGLLLLSVSSIWIANEIIKPNQVRIALLPLKVQSTDQRELANHIEEILQTLVIESDQLKLLSSSTLIGHTEKPFPYLSREYGAKWIIEGQISNFNDTTKITLSLVDARTALVVYSLTSINIAQDTEVIKFCNEFLKILEGSG